MELYGNLSNEQKEQLKGWFYGMHIANEKDIDACPIALPAGFAYTNVTQSNFDYNNFFKNCKVALKVTDMKNFKELGYHFWSNAVWRSQDSISTLFVVALPKGVKPISSEYATSALTAPDNGMVMSQTSSTNQTMLMGNSAMYDGVGETPVTDLVSVNLEAKVNMLIDMFGTINAGPDGATMEGLPFVLDSVSPYEDPMAAYFRALMETLVDREFITVRASVGVGGTLYRPTITGSFYLA